MLKTRIIKLKCSTTGNLLYSSQYKTLFGWCDIMNHEEEQDRYTEVDRNYNVKVHSKKVKSQKLRDDLQTAKQDIYRFCRINKFNKTKLTVSEVISVGKY